MKDATTSFFCLFETHDEKVGIEAELIIAGHTCLPKHCNFWPPVVGYELKVEAISYLSAINQLSYTIEKAELEDNEAGVVALAALKAAG